jgi:hypothetical protein
MEITVAHSFLTYPGKHLDSQPEIAGTEIMPSSEKLFVMLSDVYDKSDKECHIAVAFAPSATGAQQNDCRDLICSYVQSPIMDRGIKIAERLQLVTKSQSKMGLLFLMLGQDAGRSRLVISRFPAESGILAEQEAGVLSVEFIEKIFMKSFTAYKSALYVGTSPSDFWDGYAVDKQINHQERELSDYWIKDFLLSDLRDTAATGTRRLAALLKATAKKSDSLDVKKQIAAVAILAPAMAGQATSIADFASRMQLSEEVKEELRVDSKSENLLNIEFEFDADEFKKHLTYRSVELDSGAILTAPADEFSEVFNLEHLSANRVRYVAEGTIVEDKLKVRK